MQQLGTAARCVVDKIIKPTRNTCKGAGHLTKGDHDCGKPGPKACRDSALDVSAPQPATRTSLTPAEIAYSTATFVPFWLWLDK